jgi:hypothetical protein
MSVDNSADEGLARHDVFTNVNLSYYKYNAYHHNQIACIAMIIFAETID